MISYKILTILNVIIILSFCSVNNDLTEKQKIFDKKHNECVASLIKVGFKYGSGFVNYCYSKQFIFEDFRKNKTQGMYFGEYVKNIMITNKNEDKMFKQMTDKEIQDLVDLVNEYNSDTFNHFNRTLNQIKNPKEFCTGIYSKVKSSNYFTRLITNLRIKKCTKEILNNYDEKNALGNIIKTYIEVIYLKQTLSNNKMDELIESWPKPRREYFNYHKKMINDNDSSLEESNFFIRTWCNDYINKKNNEIESTEDIKLTDGVNKAIETDPIQGNNRARFTIESIENK